MIFPDPPSLGFPGVEESLSELTNNYRNSLENAVAPARSLPDASTEETKSEKDPSFQMYNFLSRDSSLVDLAMLVPVTNTEDAPAEPDPAASDSIDPTPVNELRESTIPFLDFPAASSSQQPTKKEE